MIRLSIVPKNSYLAEIVAGMRSLRVDGGFPATQENFQTVVNEMANTWRAFAAGQQQIAGVEPLKRASPQYVAGVKVRKNGPLDYTVYNDSKMAAGIENGTPQLDMKQTHPYGDKGRVANKGTKTNPRWVPYLIVPFRWGTPGAWEGHFRNIIPDQIYKTILAQRRAKIWERTTVTETTHEESNFWGEMVQRAEYQGEEGKRGWGAMLRGVGGNEEGMSSFPDSANPRNSMYFTFRIISAESPANSWIRPATAARKVAPNLATMYREALQAAVDDGLMEDING